MMVETYWQRSSGIDATWRGWWRSDIRRVPGLSPAPILCKESIQTTRYFGLYFVCEALGIADRSCRYTPPPLKCEYPCASPRIPLQTEFQSGVNDGNRERDRIEGGRGCLNRRDHWLNFVDNDVRFPPNFKLHLSTRLLCRFGKWARGSASVWKF